MSKSAFQLTVLAGLLALAGAAHADTYTNVPAGASNNLPFAYFGNGANPSGDSPKVGELFSLTSNSTLSSFAFYAIGNVASSLQLNVAQWNPTSFTVGSNLLSSTFSAVETFSGGLTTLSFNNLGLNLNAGTKYIAYLTSNDASVTGIQLSRTQTAQDATGFGQGTAYLSTTPGQGWQVPFNGFLSLQYTAVTAAVPEPESIAMLFAGLGLIGAAVKRRKIKQA